ncbi:hypothetical protein Dsin_028327 [Dipteronia sinensis]|uniref:FAD-binding PCMH-type domain-containing protein n=1 Tax=Dipteronia sinensis TaxID=43782 RepID=A0AAD9ZS01_9ROSI|nr:hypothetical protein Dsin_028327 [Dipteronia sinensis]
MKVSVCLILSVALIILFPFAWPLPDQPALNIFLQCLPDHSTPSSNLIYESIYTPNNFSFQSVLTQYVKNHRLLTAETLKPLAIVAAKDESLVQATVICAKYSGLQIRIRSGGHDCEGLSFTSTVPFIILDMFNLRSIDIDITNQTAWVQAGATLGELYYKISKKSKLLGFPAGVCPTVGVGGHFSGGGYGNLMRKYGLSVDNVVDAQIVDVGGRILDRKSMGEDLFWAIRGGGGASFGVILSWKIKLVPVPEKVTVFKIRKTLEQGAIDVVHHWQKVSHKLPEDIFIRAMPEVVIGSRQNERTVAVSFVGMFLGQTKNLMALIEKSFPELGLQIRDCNEMSWVKSTIFWAGFPVGTTVDVLLNRTKEEKSSFKTKSDYVKSVIPKEGLEKLWKKMIDLDLITLRMEWNPYGGRMNEISESETPFPHRIGNLFKIQYLVSWREEGSNVTNRYMNGIRDFYASMAPYVSSGPREAFLNYRDIDIGSISSNQTSFKDSQVYGFKYFKGNFQRLVDVKAKVDPHYFFKNEQSIPPTKDQL